MKIFVFIQSDENKISNVKRNMISLGVAHSFQQCKRVPTNKHDYKLDYIFTERGIISSNL